MAMIQTLAKAEPSRIKMGGTTRIVAELTAVPGLLDTPTDLILMLEQSAALEPELFRQMKRGAQAFVTALAKVSGDSSGKKLGQGIRVGMGAYSNTASQGVGLTDDAVKLNTGIEALIQESDPGVDPAQALQRAETMLRSSTGQKLIVFYSAIPGTAGGDPEKMARQIRDKGIQLYCLGPAARSDQLARWSSVPPEHYVCPGELTVPFTDLQEKLFLKNSRGVVLDIGLTPDFEYGPVVSCSQGNAAVQGTSRFLKWYVGDLGTAGQQTASMVYEVHHIGSEQGERRVNDENHVSDLDRQDRYFDGAAVVIGEGGGEVVPEGGGGSADFQVDGCRDMVRVSMPDVALQALGRVVELSVTLKSVCPGKRVAVTVQLTELGADDQEQVRGVKHFLVPAHSGAACQDVTLNCIRFSLPEALDLSGSPASICDPRSLRARVIANYVDSDVVPCETAAVTL